MARSVPRQVWRTARRHARLAHGMRLQPSQLGRPNSARERFPLTWSDGGALGPVVRCRLCQPGFDRYLAYVYAPAPSERDLEAIGRHFGEAHAEDVSAEEIYSRHAKPDQPKATWMAATPRTGPTIVCHRCPDGVNLISVGKPAYGDARRLRDLLRHSAELRMRTAHLNPADQAADIEAWDRGIPSWGGRRSSRAAVAEAERSERGVRADPLHEALLSILERRVRAGEPVTRVIDALARLSKDDPVAFTVTVGAAIPALAQASDGRAPASTTAVAQFLLLPEGRLPRVSARTLWRVWGGRGRR